MVHLQGSTVCLAWCRQTASSPGGRGLGPPRCSKPHRGFSLTLVPWRVRTLTSYHRKQNETERSISFSFGASSGVRPSALPAPADCILARRSRPRPLAAQSPHRGFSAYARALAGSNPHIHKNKTRRKNPSRFLWCIFRGSTVCLACAGRLRPRPAKPASITSLLKASQGLFAYARALAGSNPRIHKNKTRRKDPSRFLWCIFRGSNPDTPD